MQIRSTGLHFFNLQNLIDQYMQVSAIVRGDAFVLHFSAENAILFKKKFFLCNSMQLMPTVLLRVARKSRRVALLIGV